MLAPVALFCHHLCSHNVKRSHEICMNVAGGSHYSCMRKWLCTQGLALSVTRKDLNRLAKTVSGLPLLVSIKLYISRGHHTNCFKCSKPWPAWGSVCVFFMYVWSCGKWKTFPINSRGDDSPFLFSSSCVTKSRNTQSVASWEKPPFPHFIFDEKHHIHFFSFSPQPLFRNLSQRRWMNDMKTKIRHPFHS